MNTSPRPPTAGDHAVSVQGCDTCIDAISSPPGPPPLPWPGPRSVLLHSYVLGTEGYGRVGSALGRAIEARGVPVRYLPALPPDRPSLEDPWTARRIVGPGEADRWPAALQLQVPQARARPGQRRVAFTMSENTGLAPDQVAGLDEAELVFVPSHANRDWYRDAGVRPPIVVAPLGLSDPEVFAPRAGRRPEGPTRFGMAGRRAYGVRRKNLEAGLAAFLDAFDRSEDVRLEIHSTDSLPMERPDDARVALRRDPMPLPELAGWYRSLDAFVSPTRGEGWGMHQHEAAAVGVPVVAPIWGGLAEFLDPAESYPIAFGLAPTGESYFLGEWAEPDPDSLVDQLRAVHRDRDEAARRGRLASSRAHAFTWDATAAIVLGALDGLGVLGPAA